MKTALIAATLLLAACSHEQRPVTNADTPARSTRPVWTVADTTGPRVRLVSGDSSVTVDRDSLSRAPLSLGQTRVRRCKRGPYAHGRIVTFCRYSGPDLGTAPDDTPADVLAARIAAGDCPARAAESSPWYCRPEMLRARKQVNP